MSIRIRSWQGGQLAESGDVDELGRIIAAKGSRTWIDLTNPSAELVGAVARRLGLHPLITEDIAENNERRRSRSSATRSTSSRLVDPGSEARAEEVRDRAADSPRGGGAATTWASRTLAP